MNRNKIKIKTDQFTMFKLNIIWEFYCNSILGAIIWNLYFKNPCFYCFYVKIFIFQCHGLIYLLTYLFYFIISCLKASMSSRKTCSVKEVAFKVCSFGIFEEFFSQSSEWCDGSLSCHNPINVFLMFGGNLFCITLMLIPQYESVLRNFTFVLIIYSSFLNLTQRNESFLF